MKHIWNHQFKFWQMAVIAVALVALTGGAVALAAPDGVNNLWSAGSVRLSSSYGTDDVNVSNDTRTLVQNLSIVVPEGKKADVQASFSADIAHNVGTYAYCFAEFSVDGVLPDAKFFPTGVTKYQLIGGTTSTMPNDITVAMNGFKKNVPAGTHTINVYVTPAYSGCLVRERALNVVVNIR